MQTAIKAKMKQEMTNYEVEKSNGNGMCGRNGHISDDRMQHSDNEHNREHRGD